MKVLLIFALLGIAGIKGDTPANCLYDDIVGTWAFYESARVGDHNIVCDEKSNLTQVREITLKFPNTAIDELGFGGTWTLIYNQGFEVNIDDRSYFAFSKYKVESGKVVSYCDHTLVGWARDKTVRNWSCFRGEKKTPVAPRIDELPVLKLDRPFINDHRFIHKINSMQTLWKAKAYLEHEKYTLKEMLRRAGGTSGIARKLPAPAPATEEQKARAQFLPTNFDWRNVDGVNYVSPVRDQGSCGSCYAFTSLGALEARLRIRTKNQRQDVFSVQDVLDCSYLAQGCDGGFNYLIEGRYAEEQGLISEAHNPYHANVKKCSRNSSIPLTYVKEYNYIGGFYGGCNEELMMEALVSKGPLAVSFMVYNDFYTYSGGVYKHTGIKSNFNPLVPVNHAVLLVGYGVDERSGEKFWAVKNSWGSGWGEEGYFKILRGTNECGIESGAFSATPIP